MTDGSRGVVDKMASDMEVHIQSNGVSLKSAMWKKMVPTDIHQCLLNVCGEQTVDVSTVRCWVVCFSSDNCDSGSACASVDFYKHGLRALAHCW